MENIAVYLLKSVLILSAFYLCYTLVFSSDTSFRQNRFFLLSGIIFSLVVPFFSFPAPQVLGLKSNFWLKEISISAIQNSAGVNRSFFSIENSLYFLYLLGCILLTVRFLFHLKIILGYRLNARVLKETYGSLVFTGKKHPVFSFANSIYIDSESEKAENLDVILAHEKVHIVQLHTFDLFLLEVLAVVQWFNPMVWLYLKSLRQNHEYLADQGVLLNGTPVDKYQQVLLRNYSFPGLEFTSNLNHSLTLKRLVMMKKIKSGGFASVKLLIFAPMVLLGVYLLSCKGGNDMNDGKVVVGQQVDSTTLMPPPPPPPPPPGTSVNGNTEIDVMPEFPGGEGEMINYLAKNVTYPKDAKEKGIEGTVYVMFTVKKDGKIANAKVIRSASPMLNDESLRVVNSMPAWKPGMSKNEPMDVNFTIPIKYKLQN
ncbi:MAG: M56 family metallopeptidase [Bacteroidales bacterium]